MRLTTPNSDILSTDNTSTLLLCCNLVQPPKQACSFSSFFTIEHNHPFYRPAHPLEIMQQELNKTLSTLGIVFLSFHYVFISLCLHFLHKCSFFFLHTCCVFFFMPIPLLGVSYPLHKDLSSNYIYGLHQIIIMAISLA